LAAAITGSLRLADQLELSSLALPAISTGIFGFPKIRAAKVIFNAIQDYFTEHPGTGLKRVHLTLYDQPTLDAFLKTWPWK
jgi:O-acetyl-ADP-ribose deacetylase (regulator of RNase III)